MIRKCGNLVQGAVGGDRGVSAPSSPIRNGDPVVSRAFATKQPKFLLAASGMPSLPKKPQEFVADEAAVAESRGGVLVNIAVEEPADALVFKFGHGNVRGRNR